MLKIRRPLGRLIFNMGIAIPGKTVFLIETAPWGLFHNKDDVLPEYKSHCAYDRILQLPDIYNEIYSQGLLIYPDEGNNIYFNTWQQQNDLDLLSFYQIYKHCSIYFFTTFLISAPMPLWWNYETNLF